jgi:dTDP-4-dehydrorhamnose 3,5-epimerase
LKILDISSLALQEIKVLKFARFKDNRGYFTETYRQTDFVGANGLEFLEKVQFVQNNESYSHAGVIRGMHFQWNPCMGKLVRTLSGRMVDLVLDIRLGSPTLGRIIAFDMPADFDQWIWIPPGFAHGNYFTEPTRIEYYCTSAYNPGFEAGISPLSTDLDWNLCDSELRAEFCRLTADKYLISDKDQQAQSLKKWLDGEQASIFKYGS